MTTIPEAQQPTPASEPSDMKPPRSKFREWLSQSGPTVAAGGVALVFCIIIGSLFWPFLWNLHGTTLLRELSNFEVARGLITFLVAVTTVGIALILTVYVVVTLDSNAEKKFGLGKEVLTGLIGVLGTIVGFYFGSGKSEPKPESTVVSVKQFKLEPRQVKPGDAFVVSALTAGGRGDLEYSITFTPPNVIKDIVEPLTKPEIVASVKVPSGTPAGKLHVALQIRKKGGGTVEISGENTDGDVTVAP